MGEGPDELGKSPRRDCSCRGDSGFCHRSCIVQYAKHKSEQWDGEKIADLKKPWNTCPNCKQEYQHELAMDLASRFATFVETKYPGDRQKQLEALLVQLDAFDTQPKKKKVVKQTANKIISIVGEMKSDNASLSSRLPITLVLPARIIQLEAHAYNSLGCISIKEGTEKGTKTAVEYYEKALCVSKATDWAEGVAVSENNIAAAKSWYERRSSKANDEEGLKRCQKMYDAKAKEHGQEEACTIEVGIKLARALKKVRRSIEAERLLTKLAAISKRIHGLHHALTKRAETSLRFRKVRYVKARYQRKSKLFQALRYEEDGRKCVVQGPITKPRNVQAEKTLTVSVEVIHLILGTPVICHGLEEDSLNHINGKIGDLRSRGNDTGQYEIHFEDEDLEPRFVKQENIRILFELPEEK